MTAQIDFISSENGDWAGMYINKVCVIEDHSLDLIEVLDILTARGLLNNLKIDYGSRNDKWFKDNGFRCATILD